MEHLEEVKTDIQHLIVRYLEGSISEKELSVLQAWLEESDQHFMQFDQLRRDWMKVGCFDRYATDRAWTKVEERLRTSAVGRHRMMWRRMSGWAAAVVLLVGIAYFAADFYRDQKPSLAMHENIEPGSKKAILVLGSNEQVWLEENTDEALFEGDVAVKKEGNTLVYEDTLISDEVVEYNRLITPRGGEYSVILADGTKVWLNAESELKYPVRFTGNERQVYLKGEAYFSVTKREQQPFVVYSDKTKVTVLGTEFNIRNYAEEEMATTLVKGVVQVTHENGGECRLVPGQQAIVREEGIEVKKVEPVYYTAWKDGYFIYHEKSLDVILKELSRWYDFTYFYQNGDLGNLILTAKLRKFDRVDQIFEILSGTGHFEFATKGKTVTVLAK